MISDVRLIGGGAFENITVSLDTAGNLAVAAKKGKRTVTRSLSVYPARARCPAAKQVTLWAGSWQPRSVMTDPSNGYERVAAEFLAGRGSAPSTAIGASQVRDWARTLPAGSAVIDLGCGSGLPITKVLVSEGLNVHGIDASPSFVDAFRRNLPGVPVACESVNDSQFFNRMFDAVVAWGLIFLLRPEAQRQLIERIAEILVPGGRLLFTACAGVHPLVWNDAMTGLESRSLGGTEYRRLLSAVNLFVTNEYEDQGQNHYFDAVKLANRQK
jgi:SAM-dependent methyltransferase